MDADLGTRARIPADIDTPDKLLYGLTARQVAILSAATGVCYLIWQTIGGQVPLPVVAGIVIPTLGVAVVVALGRRDGLPLDGWLRAAVSYHRAPRRAVPAPSEMAAVPAWAPEHTDTHPGPRPVALRLPAHAINRDGVLDLGERAAVMVATGTVNLGLRTGGGRPRSSAATPAGCTP